MRIMLTVNSDNDIKDFVRQRVPIIDEDICYYRYLIISMNMKNTF